MTNDQYNRLTSAALEALQEAVSTNEQKLFEKAAFLARHRNMESKEISLRDILEAKDSLQIPEFRHFVNILPDGEKKAERFYSAIALGGLAYVTIGVLFYLHQNIKFGIEKDLGLVVAAVGILFLSIASYGQLASMKPFCIRPGENEFEIVKKWHLIEMIASKLMTKQAGTYSHTETRSFGEILNFLNDSKTLDDNDRIKLMKLLSERNQIVHKHARLTTKEIENYLVMADGLIDKIEKTR